MQDDRTAGLRRPKEVPTCYLHVGLRRSLVETWTRRPAGWLLVLFLALAIALSEACGGAGSTPPSAPQAPGSVPTSTSTSTSTETATGTPTPTATPTAQAPVQMKAPVPTAMAGELLAIGLDLSNLPPLEKLEPTTLRRVMKLFTRSLGVKCGDCHAKQGSGEVASYAAPTRRKKIAAKMWDELVVKLQLQGGSPIFCDSCHQGRVVQLDRSDKKALEGWMQASFVDRLSRKDGARHDCESCHAGREMHLLAKWGGG